MKGSCVKQGTKILASPNTNGLCDRYLLDIILGLVEYHNTFVFSPSQGGYSEKVDSNVGTNRRKQPRPDGPAEYVTSIS